jgi:cytochrome P450
MIFLGWRRKIFQDWISALTNSIQMGLSIHSFLDRLYRQRTTEGPIRFKLFNQEAIFLYRKDDVEMCYRNSALQRTPQKFTKPMRDIIGYNIITAPNEDWKMLRNRHSMFFKVQWLERYFQATKEVIDDIANKRYCQAAQSGEVIDVGQEVFEIASRAAFCSFMGDRIDETPPEVYRAVRIVFNKIRDETSNPFFRTPLWIPTQKNKEVRAARKMVYDYIKDKVESRRDSDTPFAQLIEIYEQENFQHLIEETFSMILGGTETTVSFLAWFCYFVGRDLQIQNKIHQELDQVFLENKPFEYTDLNKLEYLGATLREVLRMRSPAGFSALYAVDDTNINGTPIRKNTLVMMSQYVSHFHHEWVLPEQFRPERFLQTNEDGESRGAWHPFGGGATICIGRNFSLQEAKLLAYALLKNYSIDLVTKEVNLDRSVTVRPDRPILIRLIPRD